MSTSLPSHHVLSYPVRGGRPLRRATDRVALRPPGRRATDFATMHTVSLVVSAHNMARSIPWVFEQIPRCVDEVVLIDGSADDDAVAALAARCIPTVHRVRQSGTDGGNVLGTGFAAATGEYIVMMEADGSMWPGEIPHYLHFLDHGYDLVKGSRCIAGGGSLEPARLRSIGNHVMLTVVNRLYHAMLTDLGYGFCAFRRSFLDGLDLQSSGLDGFDVEAEMIAHALRSGLRIAEVPSLELPRRSGRSHLHAVSDGRRVLRTLLAERPGARSAAPLAVGEA